ncbi:hypothetical protein LSCM1_04157 [Leishmania martiniquensis]|uniref:Uncharacterized protein n=1 Tax=Leishmania martiniquensis TaxID=1580590 RepID=A0A836KJE6_9TRYP|nr:hypothetical protein LSCM1_04157 [Leishmania martiniquensis]
MPKSVPENEEAVNAPRPVSPSTLERLMAESEERWNNRPRRLTPENEGIFKVAEPRICQLPHGGAPPAVRAQMELNRARLEAEKEKKLEENQHPAPNTEL